MYVQVKVHKKKLGGILMNELMNIESRNTLTSLEVAQIVGKEHKNILADIRDEISKLGTERAELIFQLSEYKDTTGRKLPMYLLNSKGILQLGARYSAETRFKLIEKIEELKKKYPLLDKLLVNVEELAGYEKNELFLEKISQELKEEIKGGSE